MENKEKIEFKHFLCLYSNIALLNMLEYIKLNNLEPNKKISENNMDMYFKLNKIWNNSINNYEKQKDENIDSSINEYSSNIVKYVRQIRNFYSHNENTTKWEDSSKWLSRWEEKIIEETKSIFNKKANNVFFSQMSKYDYRAFFISLFLSGSEFQEFLESHNRINNSSITDYFMSFLKRNKNNQIRKYAFRSKEIKVRMPIELEVINYILNFNNISNNKRTFIKLVSKIMSYYFHDEKLSFQLDSSNKGIFLRCIYDGDESLINFKNLLNLLNSVFKSQDQKRQVANKIKGKIKKASKLNQKRRIETNFDPKIKKELDWKKNYNSFKNRFSKDSKIDNRHLLKIFHKVLIFIKTDNSFRDFIFKEPHFELLFQILELNKKEWFVQNEDLSKIMLDNVSFNYEEDDINELGLKIKKYILDNVNNETIYKDVFNYKKENDGISNVENIKNQNDRLIIWGKDATEQQNSPINKMFNFNNEKNELNNLKKYVRSILSLYVCVFPKKLSGKSLSIENLFANADQEKLPIEKNKLIEIFKDTIFSKKDDIKISFDNNQPNLNTKNIIIKDLNLYRSNYELINSKLFWEINALLKNEKINISAKEFSLIRKEVNEYSKNEFLYIKKAFELEEGGASERNWIMHRSLSKFSNLEALKKMIKENAPIIINNKIKNKSIDNNLFDDEIEKFNEKINKG